MTHQIVISELSKEPTRSTFASSTKDKKRLLIEIHPVDEFVLYVVEYEDKTVGAYKYFETAVLKYNSL